jgi:TonB family protein
MRLFGSLLAFMCAGWSLAAPASAALGTRAECPHTLLMESTNGTYYVSLFGAPGPMVVAFNLTLYTKNAVFSLAIPATSISKHSEASLAAYRGPAVVIKNPSTDPFLGVTVQPTIERSSLLCDAENVIVPSVETLTAADRHVDPEVATLEDQAATEAASTAPLTPTSDTLLKPLTCDTPFTDAVVDQLDQPAFPESARASGAFGIATVHVDINELGAVTGANIVQSSGIPTLDDAALASARKTTFHPARFACELQKSSHVLDFDFSSK